MADGALPLIIQISIFKISQINRMGLGGSRMITNAMLLSAVTAYTTYTSTAATIYTVCTVADMPT